MGLGTAYKTPISRMRHRVLVEQQTMTKDAAGQPIATWSTRFASEPAAYLEVSGGETVRGRQVEAGTVAVFTVNYRSGYATTDRITHDGVVYGVVLVHQVEGIKRFLDLHCRASGV